MGRLRTNMCPECGKWLLAGSVRALRPVPPEGVQSRFERAVIFVLLWTSLGVIALSIILSVSHGKLAEVVAPAICLCFGALMIVVHLRSNDRQKGAAFAVWSSNVIGRQLLTTIAF